jgi:hypothetical protein
VPDERLTRLRRWRRRVLVAYLGFVGLFVSTGAMAAADVSAPVFVPTLLTLLVATVPVILLNIGLHRVIRAVDPRARSVGGKQALVSALCFTPFEAALVLPVVNLLVARALLRERTAPPARGSTDVRRPA